MSQDFRNSKVENVLGSWKQEHDQVSFVQKYDTHLCDANGTTIAPSELIGFKVIHTLTFEEISVNNGTTNALITRWIQKYDWEALKRARPPYTPNAEPAPEPARRSKTTTTVTKKRSSAACCAAR